jgi:RNA polymerase sigma-B factor
LRNNNPNNKVYEQISEWLETYHSTSDSHAKERAKTFIVTNMYPVIRHIAKTIARRAYDPIEDLIQAGFIGLLKAIDKYNKNRNDNFRVYAGYLIIGEMKHYLRDQLNTIRVPRHIQELSIRIHNFIQTLTPEEVQNLTSDKVASALDIPKKAIDFAMQVERRRETLSLEDVYKSDESNLNYEEILAEKNYEEKLVYEDTRITFEKIIDKLPEDEKKIIDMYYKKDMNKKEIADALNLSQMCISRRMKHIFNHIAQMIIENKKDENLKIKGNV